MVADRIVIKLGTGILTQEIGRIDTLHIRAYCEVISQLQKAGKQVVVVSSGAVGMGMGKLGISERPTELPAFQKCAAVGQSLLMETWQTGLSTHGIVAAQVLLTREDIAGERRSQSLHSLIDEMLAEGIVPIVNENDSISAEEIKFGDNDQLSAWVSQLVEAENLIHPQYYRWFDGLRKRRNAHHRSRSHARNRSTCWRLAKHHLSRRHDQQTQRRQNQ